MQRVQSRDRKCLASDSIMVQLSARFANEYGPRDGQVTVREWPDYATQRVPQLQGEDAEWPRQNVPPSQEQMFKPKVTRTKRQQRERQGAKGKQQQEAEKVRKLERDKPQGSVTASTQDKYLQQPRAGGGKAKLVVLAPNANSVAKPGLQGL